MQDHELDKRFACHPPKEGQLTKCEELRSRAKSCAALIVRLCPDSRERSIALTKLEESVMWANAAIANEANG